MSGSKARREVPKEVVETVVAAAIAAAGVVIAVCVAGNPRQIVPVVVIAALIVVIELGFASSHAQSERLSKRIDDLPRSSATPQGDRNTADIPTAVPPAQDPERVVAVPVPLRQFIASARAADDPQCPTCGRYLVDVNPGATSAYRCRACATTWKWRAGTPWPDVTIVPNLGRLDRDPATAT